MIFCFTANWHHPSMRWSQCLLLIVTSCMSNLVGAQNFPSMMQLSDDGHQLIVGKQTLSGFYNDSIVRSIYLTFPNTNYWTQLTNNYNSHTDLPATMVFDGETFDSVGVRFKGQTSYMNVSGQKKSFNITTDAFIDGQNVKGYNITNLNNCFDDASFLREVLYLHQIRQHIPAARANYVQLYLNNESWGLYANVQQLNKDFYEEWFLSNDGSNWRADRPAGTGGPGPGGGGWGDGTAALNYLGSDTTEYQQYYTLKSTSDADPWTDLVQVCDVLNNTPAANLDSVFNKYMDVDRALWFLASENAFADDDSYIYKGKMDYYVYQEKETGRFTPQEYDGNSAFHLQATTSWSPFYHADDVDYPLLNKLLAVPALRQRYLAHFRTIIAQEMNQESVNETIDYYQTLIDSLVQADTKKLYSYAQFNTQINDLRNFVNNRRNYLSSNTEIAQPTPTIHSASHFVNGLEWERPQSTETANVWANVTCDQGISAVWLYYCNGLVGKFTKTLMFDDGMHNDNAANDGIYGATIPAMQGGSWVRYYIEAVSNNPTKTASYLPVGAEHDVFVYLVRPDVIPNSPVVINELMAANQQTIADEMGEYDDWVELYNRSNITIDLSNYILTDNDLNLEKWHFPEGTTIAPNSYLIVWADENGSQGDLHANFKLSASNGERLSLLDANSAILDEVSFGTQMTDSSWARLPNGIGNFVTTYATFAQNNENALTTNTIIQPTLRLYPNPAKGILHILLPTAMPQNLPIQIVDMYGQVVLATETTQQHTVLATQQLPSGLYVVRCGEMSAKLIVK